LPEVQSLRDRLSDEKRKLDEEQLRSADLENQLTRMEEDLNFKMQLLEKELTEVFFNEYLCFRHLCTEYRHIT
jgi:cell shape-determining protein MreC